MANFDWGTFLNSTATAGLGAWREIELAKAQAKAARAQARAAARNPWAAYPTGPAMPVPSLPPDMGMPPGYENVPVTPVNYYPTSGGGVPVTQANLLGGGLAVGRALLSKVPALAARLRALWPGMAEAGAVALATGLLTAGLAGDGVTGPYARAADNKVVGVMRGDIKAVRRLKKSSARVMKAFRSAGVGRRSSRPKARARTRTRIIRQPVPLIAHHAHH